MNIFTFEMCNPFGILMNNGSSFYCKGLPPPLDKFYYESSNQDSVFASTADLLTLDYI